MKATGIVRRIDDLGRVVIPKEIRRTLKIREGMPMEIFTDSSGEVILKKYSPVGEMTQIAQAYVDTLVSLTGYGAVVCDSEQVIAISGPVKKEINGKAISPQIDEILQSNQNFITNGESTLLIAKDSEITTLAVFPIASLGDVMGAVMLVKSEKSPPKVSDEAIEKLRAASMFLARQLEE